MFFILLFLLRIVNKFSVDPDVVSHYTFAMHCDITLLCKVVDNYGDIGFVYRLTRALAELHKDCTLRLIVDNLDSFASMAPAIKTNQDCQQLVLQDDCAVTVYRWDASMVCTQSFTEHPPQVILECFQCGRPQWLDALLFDTGLPTIVHIINIDYLTAEPYADDFHKLQSLTRSARVKKTNFMPGFTDKTGGLTLDVPFVFHRANKTAAVQTIAPLIPQLQTAMMHKEKIIIVFSYERDFTPVVQALEDAHKKQPLHVFVASGRGMDSFVAAYTACNASFAMTQLPFLEQEQWDALLCVSDFSFIRGEDSLSRACLLPIPYVWHAYPQDNEYQQVKVQALLDRMKPFFDPQVYTLLEEYWLLYNKTQSSVSRQRDILSQLFIQYDELKQGFTKCSAEFYAHGNLAAHLYTYIIEDILS